MVTMVHGTTVTSSEGVSVIRLVLSPVRVVYHGAILPYKGSFQHHIATSNPEPVGGIKEPQSKSAPVQPVHQPYNMVILGFTLDLSQRQALPPALLSSHLVSHRSCILEEPPLTALVLKDILVEYSFPPMFYKCTSFFAVKWLR